MISMQMPNKNLYSVRFSPNNESLIAVAASNDGPIPSRGTLYILEITPQNTLKEIFRIEHNSALYDVEWCDCNPNPSVILTASGDTNLQLWNVFAPNRPPITFSGHAGDIYSINWSKIANRIVSGSCDFSCRIWDMNRRDPTRIFFEHVNGVTQVEFHPKYHNLFASVSADGTLKIWDIFSGRSSATIPAHLASVNSCSWSRCEENTIATGGSDGFIKGWDLRQFSAPCFQLGPAEVSFKKIKFSPFSYGSLASISCDGYTKIWNCFDSSMPIHTFKNHPIFASGLDWNSLETTTQLGKLADCGFGGEVKVYNPHLL